MNTRRLLRVLLQSVLVWRRAEHSRFWPQAASELAEFKCFLAKHRNLIEANAAYEQAEYTRQLKARAVRTMAETSGVPAEFESFHDVRDAYGLSRDDVAQIIDWEEASVRRSEDRADDWFARMQICVVAKGGTLKLVAVFPDPPGHPLTAAGKSACA